jgi:hypothetical protein
MRTFVTARALALAGLAAASATAAHGGGAAVADPAWSLPALGAATAGVAGLLRLLHAAGATRAEAAARARLGAAPAEHVPLGLAETVAVMLTAQGCAHAGLIAAGAPAHSGQAAAIVLHTGLGLLGAGIVWLSDRSLAAALGELAAAIAAAVELLLALAGAARPRHAAGPAARIVAGARRGRAPPVLA